MAIEGFLEWADGEWLLQEAEARCMGWGCRWDGQNLGWRIIYKVGGGKAIS